VAYDTMLVILTLARARTRARSSAVAALRSSAALDLAAVVVRDGTLYYAAVVLVNGANVITFYVAPPLLKGELTSPASALAVTLCARLMLNLRASAAEVAPPLPSNGPGLGFEARAELFRAGPVPRHVETDELELVVLEGSSICTTYH
jgi:hypothetical protein